MAYAGIFILLCIISTASSTSTQLPPNSDEGSTNRQIIESVAPYGYQMCVRRCDRSSACLSVRYDRNQLLCELLGETSGGAEGTPAVLNNKSTICNVSKNTHHICSRRHCFWFWCCQFWKKNCFTCMTLNWQFRDQICTSSNVYQVFQINRPRLIARCVLIMWQLLSWQWSSIL
jgi:hypothetical protein